MLSLGVDTSNYATSLAVVDAARGEVVCALKEMLPVPKGGQGLRQSDAVFHHTAVLPGMVRQLAVQAPLAEVGAVGVSAKPRPVEGSYMPCFLAGVSFAAAFAGAKGLQDVHTTHQQGHLAAALFGAGRPELQGEELILFHISGGTTEMMLTRGHEILQPLGGSLDLYAGQAVDRLGVKLGFDFPAGAALSALAAECPDEIKPRVSVQGMDCHLSGLQNQCEALLAAGQTPAYAAKYCLLAVAETVVCMLAAARKAYPGRAALCAGGVMSSELVRDYVTARSKNTCFVPGLYASDNAIGVALIAAKEADCG